MPKDNRQRLLEVTIGSLPFIFLILIVVLSKYAVNVAAIILFIYTLGWLIRIIAYFIRLITSVYYLRLSRMIDWQNKLSDILGDKSSSSGNYWENKAEKWYRRLLQSGLSKNKRIDPAGIYQGVIVAVSSESKEIVESTINGVVNSNYDKSKIMLILAYEERGGKKLEKEIKELVKKYKSRLGLVECVKHPDNIAGEAKAKAGNITSGAKYLSSYCAKNKIKAEDVLVTTLDADAWPHPQYFAALTWTYCMAASRTHRSYQPIPFFTNNIWDVPALVRVVAADSSFWFMIWAVAPKRLRLFAAYSQSLKTLEDVYYWNVKTIVEDGHQYWRNYFRYNGDHRVLPVWLPVYQDAVLSNGYFKTLAAQFRQLRRWAWGTADTPWLIREAIKDKSISLPNKLINIVRQMDDYIAWSTAPLILSIGGWLPLILSPNSNQFLIIRLPYLISGLQIIALIGCIIPVTANLLNLPTRPKRYGVSRNITMLVQWLLEPVALIGFISLASLDAHRRLIFNRPLETFETTAKTRVGEPYA